MTMKRLGMTGLGIVLSIASGSCTPDRDSPSETIKPKVGVILPDSRSSTRWENADRKYLELAFTKSGISYDIQNAQGDPTTFQNIADEMIASGVTVLMIISQDSDTGKAVLDRAKSQGVPTIDYDRLTLGGSATYHVSFDNRKVGELLGNGLVHCLDRAGIRAPVVSELDGAPSDDNATLFREGYDAVLTPLYASGRYRHGPRQAVPNWENARAADLFGRMFTQDGAITGVLAANDGLANAAITVLRERGRNGEVQLTGQDATVQGLQNILLGDQCMTVYKDIKREAEAAAELAIQVANGDPRETGQTREDSVTGRRVPSVLLDPVAIYRENVMDVVSAGFVSAAELCAGDFADECAEAGVTG